MVSRYRLDDAGGNSAVADAVSTVKVLNRQLAARLSVRLDHWRRQDSGRQVLMKAALERILGAQGLSPNVYEIASRSLA